jgi:hypothetical protein
MSPIELKRTTKTSGERKMLYVTTGIYAGIRDGGTVVGDIARTPRASHPERSNAGMT